MTRQNSGSPSIRVDHPLQTVLIGTSLGPESDEVVGAGVDLARAAGARVYIVHAAHERPLLRPEVGAAPNQEQGAVASREEELRSQVQRFITDELELLGTQIREGAPHRVISRIAREIGADLIVIGAKEVGSFAGALLGSTADRVIRKARCPVLVVRNGLRVPPRRVLAPVDLSKLSGEALHCGLHLVAQVAGGAEIQVRAVFALGLPHAYATGRRTGLAAVPVERLAEEELRSFVLENPPGAPFHVETAVLSGEARMEILRDLEENPADLVILGTNGRGGMDRLVLGSVAMTVCHKAPCSVLVVSPEAVVEESHAEAIIYSDCVRPSTMPVSLPVSASPLLRW